MSHKHNIPDKLVRTTVIFLIFLVIIILGKYFKIDPERLKSVLTGRSIAQSVFVYVLLYVVTTFFIWLSKDVFKFIAAIVFGPFLSTILVFLAETINALILFSLSRFLGKEFVDNLLRKGVSHTLEDRISRFSLWTIFILRVIPLIPFRLLDLGCGLSRIRLSQYMMIVALASPARIFWVQYILAGLGEAAFKNPGLILPYLIDNKIAFIWSLSYLILAIILAFRIKSRI